MNKKPELHQKTNRKGKHSVKVLLKPKAGRHTANAV